MTHPGRHHQGGVSVSSAPASEAAPASPSERGTPPPSDSGSSDVGDLNYFAKFNSFVANPEAGFIAEFKRLAIHENWSEKQKKVRRADAVEYEIARHYGTDKTKLEKWQELCGEVKIEPVPLSITKCKKALASVYVNIFNILDHRRNPERYPIKVFETYEKFRKYTVAGRVYPLVRAKQDTFIKSLLRPVYMRMK
ncbi:hypothetical protein EJ02DRAFT_417355 [Clathrospora elynae]|uniref:Uncharacterized protein n=1 Tax=Clathrospora elynae TaxID=706981 RepID=A0A6A5T6R5_9PLEO|nr:hypothetical protein EJ02DRAFT_417355 [Clathrospora elynae]